MKYLVQIVACSDPMLWYKNYVGQYFEVLGQPNRTDGFPVKQPDGYRNFIRLKDCVFYQAMPLPTEIQEGLR